MTVYGLDISHYQTGLKLSTARDQGFVFSMAKVTQGDDYVDPQYTTFRDAAKTEKLLFAAYHFLTSDADPVAQAKFAVSKLGDKSIPIMLDVEKTETSVPNITHVKKFIDAVKVAGGRVSLVYIPHWYWQDYIGSPSLAGLPPIVASNYVSSSGYAATIYDGDSTKRWNAYGGQTPVILQFTDKGKYSGYSGDVDFNAFRGTEAELKSKNLFKDWTPVSLSNHAQNPLDGFTIGTIVYGDDDTKFNGYKLVWRLQKLLQITADGQYGPTTANAVKEYIGSGDGKRVGIDEWTVLLGLSK